MITYLKKLVDERVDLTALMTRTTDAAASESRDLTEAEETSLVNLQTRCAEIDRQLEVHNAQAESARAFAGLQVQLEATRPDSVVERRPAGATVETTSFGQGFVESAEFRGYRGHGQSGAYPVDGFLETRAPITTASLNIPAYQWPRVFDTAVATPLLDVVTRVPVSSGVVEWVEIGAAPAAGAVAEGAAKPEAAITLTPRSSSLDTLAHWVQITRQALEDATYIQSLLETKLRQGLFKKAEADLALAIIGATTATATAATLLEAIRVGIGTVQGNGYNANAVLLNPADWAALDVDVMGTAGGATGRQTFWGLTAVSVPSLVAGTAYVGDFRSAVAFFDRNVTNVFITDSHASLFISNILVILAEARVKSAVVEPLGIAECTTVP